MIPIISIVGVSNTGKTTVLEGLIAELRRRGYRVAAIKHCTHGFEIDHTGRDTHRLTQAGADTVIAASAEKTAVVQDGEQELERLGASYCLGADLILTEGFKSKEYPKVEVVRSEVSPTPLMNDDSLIAVVSDDQLDLEVPRFARRDLAKLADLIEQRYLAQDRQTEVVHLSVNGNPIPLRPFARGVLANTIRGLVGTLKGTDGAKEIRIVLRPEE